MYKKQHPVHINKKMGKSATQHITPNINIQTYTLKKKKKSIAQDIKTLLRDFEFLVQACVNDLKM